MSNEKDLTRGEPGQERFAAQTPPPASETLDVEGLTALFALTSNQLREDATTDRERAAQWDAVDSKVAAMLRADADAPGADADMLDAFSAALPSLLRAQTRLQEIETALANTGISAIMDEFRDVPDAITQMALHIRDLEPRNAKLERDLAQAQTERDAAVKRIKGFEALVKLHIGDNVKLAAERDEWRSQVSALEAAQRECAARVTALPSELMHDDSGEQMRFLSRPAVLEALAPVLHVTPAQP